MFSCGEQNSALQFWRSNEMSPTLTDTYSESKRQGIIYHSSSDIFWALDKQVHHRDPHGKSLMSRTNPLSLPIHIKTLWIAGGQWWIYHVKKVIWHTVMVLCQKSYRGVMCGQSGEVRPHSVGSHVCCTQPDAASTVICLRQLHI